MSSPSLRVRRADAALLVIDLQARLAGAMEPAALDAVIRNTLTLLAAAERLQLPVLVSEQYPQGLGNTLPVLREALGRLSPKPIELSKLAFSLADEPPLQTLLDTGRRTLVVVGMETHICVYQSVRGLVERGCSVHVPVDAVISRTPANQATGLQLIERAGGICTSTETVLFDLLERAGTEEFRALSKLVK